MAFNCINLLEAPASFQCRKHWRLQPAPHVVRCLPVLPPTIVGLGEVEVGDAFLIESDVPSHHDVILGLRLFQLLVVIGLELHQRAKDVLILISILVAVADHTNLIIHLIYSCLHARYLAELTETFLGCFYCDSCS